MPKHESCREEPTLYRFARTFHRARFKSQFNARGLLVTIHSAALSAKKSSIYFPDDFARRNRTLDFRVLNIEGLKITVQRFSRFLLVSATIVSSQVNFCVIFTRIYFITSTSILEFKYFLRIFIRTFGFTNLII